MKYLYLVLYLHTFKQHYVYLILTLRFLRLFLSLWLKLRNNILIQKSDSNYSCRRSKKKRKHDRSEVRYLGAASGNGSPFFLYSKYSADNLDFL